MSAHTVLYVQHTFVLGGSAMSLLYLLQQVDRSRYEPVVACLYDAPEVVDLYRSNGFRTVVVGGELFAHTTGGWWPLTNPLGAWRLLRWLLRFPAGSRRLRSAIAQLQPDLVHLNSLTLAPFAGIIRRRGAPVIAHVRESVHPGHLGIRRRLLQRALRRSCDAVIYICEHDRTRLSDGGRGEVIYNFVDFDRFDRTLDRHEARRRLGIAREAKVVLYMGGVSRIKGILPLVRALPKVRQGMPELLCLMAGAAFPDGRRGTGGAARALFSALGWRSSEEDEARGLFVEGEMGRYVRLLPFSPDVPSLLAAADVVVFPSVEPHFARPVLEAAAMARPVVASDIGGVNEIIQNGSTGLLVPPGDVDALAAALVRVLADVDGEAVRMGERAYRQACVMFEAERNARATFAVYDRVLAQPTATPVALHG